MRISDWSSDVSSSDLARQRQVGRDQLAQRAAGVECGVQRRAAGGADAAHAFVQVRRLLVAGVVAGLFPRLALGHVIPPVTAVYLSPPPLRASLAMIQPAAKATPNEAIGRSRIRSAALSTRSWPLTTSRTGRASWRGRGLQDGLTPGGGGTY